MAAYDQILSEIFRRAFREGDEVVVFEREQIASVATDLGLERPRNLGDVVYTFRFRKALPESIWKTAPAGKEWIIRQSGDALYRFVLVTPVDLSPRAGLLVTKVPNATPGIIAKHALDDEQALLALIRYNRLIDVFAGVACYSLQNHLRTKVKDVGQVETDEIYVGVDRHGAQYVFPVQAKGGRDRLSVVQVEQDVAMCAAKFPTLICRPVAVQFMSRNQVAVMELAESSDSIRLVSESHYELVSPDALSDAELAAYARAAGRGV